ncbi:MAG TPA: CocE/NonD family hydrolase [Solirubrobacteraceae bacterium]|nr:CocE/NonD family hydrolase [Solirubrobacteraceae bacterium]
MPRLRLLAAATVVAALAPAAAHAEPRPFDHRCVPRDGVRWCPTDALERRVPSFDGTPIDVDVTLPPSGDGPFPTLLLLHGLGGTKTSFLSPTEGNAGYDAPSFARAGYAVVTPTARGFGNSCGNLRSRTDDCRNGFTRLADMRYEVRDLQTLLGILVDQGITQPDRIGTTGVSYGGGMSLMLGFLKDRIRLPDGRYAPWTSPNGTPLSIAAAWPRWLWSNGESIFLRNGRTPWSRTPNGVITKAYADAIFLVGMSGFVAPPGGPISTDITRWKAQLDRGVFTPDVQPTLDTAYVFHGVAAVRGRPSPLLLQSGWTDALFPVGQSLAVYDAIRRRYPGAPVGLQLGDLGHSPGANHPRDTAAFNEQGLAFFDGLLKSGPRRRLPRVTAYTMTCPRSAPSGGGPFRAEEYEDLARGALRFGSRGRLRIDSRGRSEGLAEELNPLTGHHCQQHAPDRSNPATFLARSPGVTLIGRPVLSGRVRAAGANGQIIARLWDRAPFGGQRLITRGAYRLVTNQRGRFRFALDGNGWRFARGHRIVVELLGRDEPTYKASPNAWRATLSDVRVALPVRERPRR